MAAARMKNKEIAQALFVTLKTVEGHLSHVYRKLDITSRAELADRLAADARNCAGWPPWSFVRMSRARGRPAPDAILRSGPIRC
jgi:hypothetical protein